jgi:hypothetical protein
VTKVSYKRSNRLPKLDILGSALKDDVTTGRKTLRLSILYMAQELGHRREENLCNLWGWVNSFFWLTSQFTFRPPVT